MILGKNRLAVIDNIKRSISAGDFYAKVETSDPVLSFAEAKCITEKYLKERKSLPYRAKSLLARAIANVGTNVINKNTEIIGELDPSLKKSGFIITSNHFSPLENTVIRYFLRKNGVKKLSIVSQVTNFAMDGAIGFLMRYADTVPISSNPRYLARDFTGVIKEKICRGEPVLIYPEQEMWFNYRKPRPPKQGAYYFAGKVGCPILSCFVEIIDIPELETCDFYKTKYRLHVLGVLYPDSTLGARESSELLAESDYKLKKEAYERIYKKPLSYTFHDSDIGGWINYTGIFEDE